MGLFKVNVYAAFPNHEARVGIAARDQVNIIAWVWNSTMEA